MNRLLSILILALTVFTARAQTTVAWLTNATGLQSFPPVASRQVVAVGNESAGWSMWHWNAASTATTNETTVKYSGLTAGRWIQSPITGTATSLTNGAKLDASGGVGTNLTSSTLSSVSPTSLVTGGYIMNVGDTNLDAWMSIATWGDSLTRGSGSGVSSNAYPAALGAFTGFRVSNGGTDGDTSTQIRTRQLAGSNTWAHSTIIWAGRNNYDQQSTILADIAAMVSNLATVGNTNRFLVMGILNGAIAGEQVGGVGHTAITNINYALSQLYGANYVGIREYLVSLAGAGDSADVTADRPPASLRSDTIHLNGEGYLAVARYLTTNKLATIRGPWSSVTTPAAVAAILRQPGPIGSEAQSAGSFTTINGTSLTITNAITATSSVTTNTAQVGSLGINVAAPLTQFNIKQTTTYAAPTIGTGSGSFFIGSSGNNYGLYAGVAGTGDAWFQTMANGSATAYNLWLNPSGGSVTIGTTSTPSQKLLVGGTVGASYYVSSVAIGTPPFYATSTTKVDNFNTDLLDGIDSAGFQPASAGLTNLAAAGTTGSGAVVLATSPALVTPTISSFTAGSSVTTNTAQVGSLGINVASPLVQFNIKQTANYTAPTIGTGSGSFFIGSSGNNYGLYAGVSSTGNSWFQTMANGSATAYDLWLNPSGGNVTVGTSGASSYKLTVGGTIGGTSITASTGLTVGSSGTILSNLRHGTAVLIAGTKTVSDANVTANTRWTLTSNTDGGTPGWLRVSARSVGTSFTITSSSGADTSTVAYWMWEP